MNSYAFELANFIVIPISLFELGGSGSDDASAHSDSDSLTSAGSAAIAPAAEELQPVMQQLSLTTTQKHEYLSKKYETERKFQQTLKSQQFGSRGTHWRQVVSLETDGTSLSCNYLLTLSLSLSLPPSFSLYLSHFLGSDRRRGR